jgi:hypothetical protein
MTFEETLAHRICDHIEQSGRFNIADVAMLIRAATATERERVLEALNAHWLSGIECNHEHKSDTAICACGWISLPRPNVGEAVAKWAEHAIGGNTAKGTGK